MTMYDDSRVVTLLREIDPPFAPPDRLSAVTRRARRGESRRASALAGVMALVLAGGVLAAVNLGDGSQTEQLTVAGAADATAAARTARLSMTIKMSAPPGAALPNMDSYAFSGLVDFEHERFVMKGRLAGEDLELRGIGRDRWISALGSTGKKWEHSTDDTKGGSFDQVDPAQLLAVLTSKGKPLSRKVVGNRTVFVLRVPSEVLAPGAAVSGPEDVTVSVDGDGLVRTLETTLGQGGGFSMHMRLSYDDFGVKVDVRPPPSDQVVEASDADAARKDSEARNSYSFSTSGNMSPEACAALRKQRDEAVARADADRRADISKAFDQALAISCAKK